MTPTPPTGPTVAALTIDDVKAWLMLDGKIGHILMCTRQGWHTTACRTWTPNGDVVYDRPARKCRACMAALPTLKVTRPANTEDDANE